MVINLELTNRITLKIRGKHNLIFNRHAYSQSQNKIIYQLYF